MYFLYIYSVYTILYPYTLPLILFPWSSSSLCLSCNLSSSLRSLQNALELMFFVILKGLYLLLSNFFEGQFNWIFLFSSHTWLPAFSPCGFRLFLSNYCFMFFWDSSIACAVCFQLFCRCFMNSSTCGIPVWTIRSSFQGCLPKFNSNGIFPVAACFLSLYENSAVANQSVQSSCW